MIIPLPKTLADWKNVAELLAHVTVALGLPIAILQYRRSKLREQADREYGTYNALDEKYLEFQSMCFAHPALDIFDVPDDTPHTLSDEERKQELIAFTMLISIFERAYLMYHDQSLVIKEAQWTGWDEYIRAYCQRANFRNAWAISGETFDRNFENYVEALMVAAPIQPALPQLSSSENRTIAVQPFTSITDPDYLRSLALVSQYGPAGGAFNTNELSYMLSNNGSGRTTRGFILRLDGEIAGLAIASALPAVAAVLLHEFIIGQRLTGLSLNRAFWRLLFERLTSEFPLATRVVAESPVNEPRHLKTEVFNAALAEAGFRSAKWPYYLPRGFNGRTTAGKAQLLSTNELDRQMYLQLVQSIYRHLYVPLYKARGADPHDFEREIRNLEVDIERDVGR